MGLLDDVLNNVTGAAPATTSAVEGSQSPLISAALSMLTNQSGGISGLAHQFTAKGLGDIVHSWISTGQNLPISPSQLEVVRRNSNDVSIRINSE